MAISALGGTAYLADFAIGANIGISYGTTNALWGIAVFTVVIFATGFPLAYYAARHNLDLDLITRGSGFGYYGSVVSNVIFATFTFIFFALEGSIMAQGLRLGLGVPVWAGYAVSTLIIFPLVIYGMKVLSSSSWGQRRSGSSDGHPVRLPAHQPPRLGDVLLRLPGREGSGWDQSRLDHAGRRGVPVPDRADRRTDRLSTLHAAPDPGELSPVVAGDDPGRSRLGDLRGP